MCSDHFMYFNIAAGLQSHTLILHGNNVGTSSSHS